MKRFIMRSMGMLASVALAVTTVAANSTCFLIMNQPEMPDDYKSLRKF